MIRAKSGIVSGLLGWRKQWARGSQRRRNAWVQYAALNRALFPQWDTRGASRAWLVLLSVFLSILSHFCLITYFFYYTLILSLPPFPCLPPMPPQHAQSALALSLSLPHFDIFICPAKAPGSLACIHSSESGLHSRHSLYNLFNTKFLLHRVITLFCVLENLERVRALRPNYTTRSETANCGNMSLIPKLL